MAEAAWQLGLAYWRDDQFSRALPPLVRSRDLYEVLGDSLQLARALNSLGATYYQNGVYEPALQAFLRSREIRRAIGDLRGEAVALTNVGKTYHDWRQFDRAIATLGEAVGLAERSGDQQWLGYALHSLAMVQFDRGEYDDARRLLTRSLSAYRMLSGADSTTGWSINTLALARIQMQEGRFGEARAGILAVLARARDGESARGEAHALLRLGELERLQGRPTQALPHLQQALALTRGITQRPMMLEIHEQLALAEESRGNASAALLHLRAHAALRDSVFDQRTAQRVAGMELEMEAARQRDAFAALRSAQTTRDAIIARQRVIVALGAALLILAAALAGTLYHFNRQGQRRENELARTNAELQVALSEVRTLSGFIPICANCKRVRDDEGYWQAVETYLSEHSDASFSHSICTSCGPALYGEAWDGHPSAPQPGGTARGNASEG